MRTFVLPYRAGSVSARDLATALGCRRIKLQNSRYFPRASDRIINWGNSSVPPEYLQANILNPSTEIAANKLIALVALDEGNVQVPDFTIRAAEAREWITNDIPVIARHLLRADSGRGIAYYSGHDDFEEFCSAGAAPLYTKYIKKQDEYRVHVVNGAVIDTQRKMRRTDVPDDDVNWQIRNHSNGFIFGREGVQHDAFRDELAIAAVRAVALDFGAVDIIYNEHSSTYYVLEVNSAPGLTGTTLAAYTSAFTM